MGNVKQNCKLSNLNVGECGKVINLKVDDRVVKRHLLDMGITKGAIVKIKKIAPLGDPVDIELRGYELVICKKFLEGIEVIKLQIN